MFIDSIELFLVRNKFRSPWRTAYGTDYENCVVITRMTSGNFEGWSESAPLPSPNYAYEWGEGAFEVASRFLAPSVVGKEMPSYKDVYAAMADVKGNPFAKAAIEMPWWTLEADIKGVSLHNLFEKSGTPEVDVGSAVGICDTYDEVIKRVGMKFDEGCKRVKLKVAPGWDVDMVAAVRSAFPDKTLHIDCNASFDRNDTEVFKKLDKFHLAMIEQPFAPSDLVGHSRLAKMIETPICLDESIDSPLACRQAIELECCKFVNIKPGRVGGFGNSIEINRLCAENGITCWVGGLLESDIGKACCVELACLDNMGYPHDIAAEKFNYIDPIGETRLEYSSPRKFMGATHKGTPIKPNLEKLKEKTVKYTKLEA